MLPLVVCIAKLIDFMILWVLSDAIIVSKLVQFLYDYLSSIDKHWVFKDRVRAIWLVKGGLNNNNNNNMYLKSSIQTSSIDYIKENIHITLNISSNIPIQ